jgi:hypothetical protein
MGRQKITLPEVYELMSARLDIGLDETCAAGTGAATSAKTSAKPGADHENVLLADEVRDLLRIARLQKPWWRDYSLLVALLAFALSLIVAVISTWTSDRKDIHEQQAQLSSIVQNLNNITLKQAELITTNQGKDYSNISGLINLLNAQHLTLLHNADDVASRLGNDVTATELIEIAVGLEGQGNLSEAHRLLSTAVNVATTPTEEALALRTLGTLEIASATSPKMMEEGDSRFKRALQLGSESKFSDISQFPQAIAYLRMFVEFDWASALASRNCDEARRHFRDGQEYLSKIPSPSTPEVEQIRSIVKNDLEHGTINNQPGCAPAKPSG